MNVQIAIDNKKDIRVCRFPIYERKVNPTSTMHTNSLSFDYCHKICGLADEMVNQVLDGDRLFLQMKQRMVFFNLTLLDTQFRSDSHHFFVKSIKRCMDEVGVWRPLDRWLLSVSSPWAVKSVWNLKRIMRRLEHPTMIIQDLKKIFKQT